ncbi:zinc-binding dehydrogenase [Streptomonospora litoralis]|uniref:Zinc-binding dehydrogenase n=1 Tax=Streptomonospora litoralis TaxID=2498135 RepID=A0A4P6PV71_9ACTN|nr:zinc-binding dehydrogenase [Streptomonospora litoralis]QBI51925.1 hypothetical protein EKD16_00520 [Streptomonospora litoralis]
MEIDSRVWWFVGVHPTRANLAKSVQPGPYSVLMARPVTKDLDEVARAAGRGALRPLIARTVPLSQAIPALTELEQNRIGKRGKLIVAPD